MLGVVSGEHDPHRLGVRGEAPFADLLGDAIRGLDVEVAAGGVWRVEEGGEGAVAAGFSAGGGGGEDASPVAAGDADAFEAGGEGGEVGVDGCLVGAAG